MAHKVLYVSVNPAIMTWARDSAGLDKEAVAGRLKVTVRQCKDGKMAQESLP
jgi:hypothetical protein